MRNRSFGKRRVLIPVCVLVLFLSGSAIAQSDPVINSFELGDSQIPELPGSGDVLSVSGIPGPDWEELFNADGSLRDEVGNGGNPPANGIPDFVDLYDGRGALFIADDVSVGTATDLTIRFGAENLGTGPVSTVDDLGNSYAYFTADSQGDLLVFLGVERMNTGPSQVEFEFNQKLFRLGHGWPSQTGWEIVGLREDNDVRVILDFGADGMLSSLAVDGWEEVADGAFGWVRKETLTQEGCNSGDPGADPPIDAQTLCAFRNADVVAGGTWPSYDGAGQPTTDLNPACFFEVGLNIARIVGVSPPPDNSQGQGQGQQDSQPYRTVQLKTPGDLAFGYFGGGGLK